MRIGSLFSGIGGLELGLEMAGLGETVWQVEQNKFCQKILQKHWPNAQRFDDIRQCGKANLEYVDLICGGFPCQDISKSNCRGLGLEGSKSGLWYEFSRIIGELNPRWVVVENVESGAKKWLDSVQEQLGDLGYETIPVFLQARYVGLRHRRGRIFIIANVASFQKHDAIQKHAGSRDKSRWIRNGFRWEVEPPFCREVHGVPKGLDNARLKALGNSVVPQCAEIIGNIIKLIQFGA